MASVQFRVQQPLDALAAGGKMCEVTRRFGVCPARVSQMRRELADGWREFRAV